MKVYKCNISYSKTIFGIVLHIVTIKSATRPIHQSVHLCVDERQTTQLLCDSTKIHTHKNDQLMFSGNVALCVVSVVMNSVGIQPTLPNHKGKKVYIYIY